MFLFFFIFGDRDEDSVMGIKHKQRFDVVRTISNLFQALFHNDSGLQDLLDLFRPKISYDAPTRECVGLRDIRSWLQDSKCPEVTEVYDEMSNTCFRYVFYMILG